MKMENLLNKLTHDFINNANNNFKLVRIEVLNSHNVPIIIVSDNYVRNNFEYEELVKSWEKAKKVYGGRDLSLAMFSVEQNNEGEWIVSNVPLKTETV